MRWLILALFLLLAAGCAAPRAAPYLPASLPFHTSIVATTFWVGEVFDATRPDGSQVCSAYDPQWAFHWSGVNMGHVPEDAPACAGAIVGGCDGVPGVDLACDSEPRVESNGWFPSRVVPLENPFYLDLPFDDVNDEVAFEQRCRVIPWANESQFAGRCGDKSVSFMKNRWVELVGPSKQPCFGQVEDAGPSHDGFYHDAEYVFGSNDARPFQREFNNAGLDVSPALNGCLGFADVDGEYDVVSWRFVDGVDVPSGPWLRVVTRS